MSNKFEITGYRLTEDGIRIPEYTMTRYPEDSSNKIPHVGGMLTKPRPAENDFDGNLVKGKAKRGRKASDEGQDEPLA